MDYYFDDIEQQKRLKKILDSWLGTPYRHRCGVKGLGADCIHFVGRVLEEMGLLKWRKSLIPDYPRDWHLHSTRELLAEAIEKELKVEKRELLDFRNGDIICSYYGKASSHVGIFFDGYVYQALDEVGVIKLNVADQVAKRAMRFSYRLLK